MATREAPLVDGNDRRPQQHPRFKESSAPGVAETRLIPMNAPTPARIRAAWIIAVTVDALQIGLFPVTATLSTWVDKPLDIVAMFLLWRLLGWHWVLAPSFVFELVPFAELTPTWTLAVWYLTRRVKAQQELAPLGQDTLSE